MSPAALPELLTALPWFTDSEVAAAVPMAAAVVALRKTLLAAHEGWALPIPKTMTQWADGDAVSSAHALGGFAWSLDCMAIFKTWVNTPAGASQRCSRCSPPPAAPRSGVARRPPRPGRCGPAAISGLATRDGSLIPTPTSSPCSEQDGRPFGRSRAVADGPAAATEYGCGAARPGGHPHWLAEQIRRRARPGDADVATAVEDARHPGRTDRHADHSVLGAVSAARDQLAHGAHLNAVGAILPANAEFDPGLLATSAWLTVVDQSEGNAPTCIAGATRAFRGRARPPSRPWSAVHTLADVVAGKVARPRTRAPLCSTKKAWEWGCCYQDLSRRATELVAGCHVKFRSDPARIRGSIAPRSPRSPTTARSTSPASRTGPLAARLRLARHLDRRLDRRARRQSVAERIAAIRAVAAAVDDAVPFLPGTGSAKLDETLELTAAARDAGADAASGHHPVLRAADAGGALRWYRRSRGVPRPADRDLQRAVPDRGRHRPGDRGPAVPRLRELRRHQGDDEGLRALLPRPAPVRAVTCRVVGHRVARPAAAGPGRRRVHQRGRRHRPCAVARCSTPGRRVSTKRPRAALRPAPARRPALRRDQPRARQVGPRAARVSSRPRTCGRLSCRPARPAARRSTHCSPRPSSSWTGNGRSREVGHRPTPRRGPHDRRAVRALAYPRHHRPHGRRPASSIRTRRRRDRPRPSARDRPHRRHLATTRPTAGEGLLCRLQLPHTRQRGEPAARRPAPPCSPGFRRPSSDTAHRC